jgi:hypothetical protein
MLGALDREYLYTLLGGLKPISDGGHIEPVGVEFAYPDLSGVTELHQLLPAWQCGDELYADIEVSWQGINPSTGKRKATLMLVNRPAFQKLLQRKQDLFGKFGFTRETNPSVVYQAAWANVDPKLERAPSPSERATMIGLLMGYPDLAVEWYAKSDSTTMNGEGYQWVQVPVYSGRGPQVRTRSPAGAVSTTYFWAKPHQLDNPQERNIQALAGPILADYKARRERYIGPGKRGVVEMMRDWYDDGKGRCSPSNATRGATSQHVK